MPEYEQVVAVYGLTWVIIACSDVLKLGPKKRFGARSEELWGEGVCDSWWAVGSYVVYMSQGKSHMRTIMR